MTSPPPDSPLTELTSISQLLHLTHHRNKNQHRLAKWWKAFSVLRRQVGKLVTEVETLERVVKFSGGGHPVEGEKKKKKGKAKEVIEKEESKYVRAARETVEERVEFMRVWVVGKCYLSFSNVIADNQYAALGLMLMATLARVQTLLQTLGKEPEVQSKDADGDQELPAEEGSKIVEAAPDTDLGEVVSREAIPEMEGDDGVSSKKSKKKRRARVGEGETAGPGAGDAVTPAKRPKKKRKKGGDAFDDMFAGLI